MLVLAALLVAGCGGASETVVAAAARYADGPAVLRSFNDTHHNTKGTKLFHKGDK